MVLCDDCQEWFHISIHVQIWWSPLQQGMGYSINCSRNTDLDLYIMILHSLTGCMYVAIIATWLAVCVVCLLHTMLLYIAKQLYNN